MRDTASFVVERDRVEREAEAVADAFRRQYPHLIGRLFGLLGRLDAADADLARVNARLPAADRLRPMSARLRACPDPRHARVIWASVMTDVPFTPPARRRV